MILTKIVHRLATIIETIKCCNCIFLRTKMNEILKPKGQKTVDTRKICKMRGCQINETKKCHAAMVVYLIECQCGENYVGSTTRTLHQRFKEHNNVRSSQVYQHKEKCKNKLQIGKEFTYAKLRMLESLEIIHSIKKKRSTAPT